MEVVEANRYAEEIQRLRETVTESRRVNKETRDLIASLEIRQTIPSEPKAESQPSGQ